MRMKVPKSKGLIGRLYDSAKPYEKQMFRAELLKASNEDSTDYNKRFRDHYQYCENPRTILAIYLDLARQYLGYVDTQPLPTSQMLETLQMQVA